MRYLCVTVTEASSEGERNLERLVDSLDRQGAAVDLVLVVRGGAGHETRHERGSVMVHPLAAPHGLALSVARNLALRQAGQTELLDAADVVAFPDDDCRYPDGLLSRVAAQLASSRCDCVTGAYGPSVDAVDRRRFPLGDAPLTPGVIMRSACSGSMFFTGRAVRAIGDFDVRLGLGATYGASEDADYVLRALALGFAGAYRPRDIVVEHSYKAHRPTEYYVGNVAVLAKHAHGRAGTRLLLARRLLGGVLLALRSQLPFADLRRAVGASFALLLRPNRRPEALDAAS
jgi:glycosyltransferase involved in cell wall biosynthesis